MGKPVILPIESLNLHLLLLCISETSVQFMPFAWQCQQMLGVLSMFITFQWQEAAETLLRQLLCKLENVAIQLKLA